MRNKRAEADGPFRLITIAISHYCEKARWALDRLDIEYQEEAHLPFFHIPAVKRQRGRRSTPVLVSAAGVFPDSTQILGYLDRYASPSGRLYPDDSSWREVSELEEHFDEGLGVEARRFVYHYLLPSRDLVLR